MDLTCPICTKVFHVPPSWNRKYCSMACSAVGRRGPWGPRTNFWDHVQKTDGCWYWTGSVRRDGYGYWGRHHYAHKVSYVEVHGPVPEDRQIDHVCHSIDPSCTGGWKCRHRRCVRPDHLEAVTHATNVLRGRSPSARQAKQTHCIRGHPFDEANTYRLKRGGRQCRSCRKVALQEYLKRQRAAS